MDNTQIETDLLKELKVKEGKDGKFFFKNQRVMLTYKSHIDKEEFKAWISTVIKVKPKKCYIAHENGEGDEITPYEHSHVVVDFGKAFQTTKARIFDFIAVIDGFEETIHPHISVISNNASWKKSCKYICKEDKTVILEGDDVLAGAESIWAHNNIQDALRNCDLKDAVATIQVYAHKKLEWGREIVCAISDVEDMYPHQRKLYDIIMGPINNRVVYWNYCKHGNTGKTEFLKYMNITNPDKCMWIVPSGKGSDIINVFWDHLNKGWRGDTLIINLAKSAGENSECNQIYPIIETFKDGLIFSTKYQGGSMMIPPMHVIVMSNMLPQVNKLSRDRWIVKQVTDDKDLVDMDIGEVLKHNGEIPDVNLNKSFDPFGTSKA